MAAKFGMVGLGTMGLNLVLNLADKGISVCGYDRNAEQQEKLRTEGSGKPVTAVGSMQDLVNGLSVPRIIMLLVPAGKIVDMVLDELVPLLSAGDIVIDGGNSHFTDTDIRIKRLSTTGIHFSGMGVSGGEEGARLGPSLMPGGNEEAYASLKPILEKIAAQTPEGPCVSFIGKGSAGHYTKMVHNGIEYAMMQLISEVYGILKYAGYSNPELSQLFHRWNQSVLQSFLIEITAVVLEKTDDDTGLSLVDMILDKAKQKGTGMWTSQSAMELNVPLPTIDVAVSMRYLSALKEERVKASAAYTASGALTIDKGSLEKHCAQALRFGFILSYAQGLQLLSVASALYTYNVNISEVIRTWKGGCIIRSLLLNDLGNAYITEPSLSNIILSPLFQPLLNELKRDTVALVNEANKAGLSVAALSASVQYLTAYTTGRLPANLIQAQRDFFGAHTYERTDKPGSFHAEWVEKPPVVTSELKPKEE